MKVGLDAASDPRGGPTLPLHRIGRIGDELGSGGQAIIFALTDPSFVFKQYRKNIDARPSELDNLIMWRARSLDDRDRRYLDSRCCWPVRRIVDGGKTVGVVLHRIPEDFFVTLKSGNRRPRELQYMILRERSEPIGVSAPSTAHRVHFLADLAGILQYFSEHRIAHGDISMKNVLWSANGEPNSPLAYVLDCDGVKLHDADRALPEVTTARWTDPRVVKKIVAVADIDSDLYALGLAFFRCYFTHRGEVDLAQPRVEFPSDPPTTPELRNLAGKALSHRAGRPTGREWRDHLTLLSAQLDTMSRQSPLTHGVQEPGRSKLTSPASPGSAPALSRREPRSGAHRRARKPSSSSRRTASTQSSLRRTLVTITIGLLVGAIIAVLAISQGFL